MKALTVVLIEGDMMADLIYSPLEGKAINITDVNDPMFSQKMLGDGVAVYPKVSTGLFAKNGSLHAPCDGVVIMVFTEKHAIGFRTNEGHEILIHMGIETVDLNGAPFIISCKVGDTVKHGDKIGEVNWKMILKAGKDTVVPIVWTNNETAKEITILKNEGQVDLNTVLYSI